MILGVDIGGTAVKMGLVERDGTVTGRREADVRFDGYRTPILTTVLRTAADFLTETGVRVEGIGVSATGQVDDRTGTVIGTNGSIPGYEGTCFRAEMEQRFGVPVRVLNDANAAVLGEAFTGAAKGCRDVLMVTLGTGVGGGILTGGRLLSGRRGIAGELGHFTIDAAGAPCSCGRRGCYEQYASTTALVRLARAEAPEAGIANGRDVFRLAEGGHGKVCAALSQWLDRVAAGLCGLVHLLNPELVLIGGGVSRQEALLVRPLRERVLAGVMPRFAEGLRLEAAALGNDAGLIGAVRFWLDKEEAGK